MKKLVSLGVITAGLLVAQMSMAAPKSPDVNKAFNHHKGLYAEINGGGFFFSNDLFNINTHLSGFLLNGTVGYQFNSYFAIEAGYNQFFANRDSLGGVDVAIKGILPVGKRVSLSAKLGGMRFMPKAQDNNIYPYVGLGVAYAVTKNLDVTVQSDLLYIPWASTLMTTGGLTYHFGV